MKFKLIVMFIGLIFSVKSVADFSADIKKTEYLIYAVNVMSTNQAPLKKLIKVTSTKDQQKVNEKFNEFTKSGINLKAFYNQLYVYNKKNELMYTIEKDYNNKNTILINGFDRFEYDPKNIWGSLFEGDKINNNTETSVLSFLMRPAYATEIDNSRRVIGKDYYPYRGENNNAEDVQESLNRTMIHLATAIHMDSNGGTDYMGSGWRDVSDYAWLSAVEKESTLKVVKNKLKEKLGLDVDHSEDKTQCRNDKYAKANIFVGDYDKVFTVEQFGKNFRISEPSGDKSVYYNLNVTSEIRNNSDIEECLKTDKNKLEKFLTDKIYKAKYRDPQDNSISGYDKVKKEHFEAMIKATAGVTKLLKQEQKNMCKSDEYLDLINPYYSERFDKDENRNSRAFSLVNKLNPEKCVNNKCTKITDTQLVKGLVNDNKLNLLGDKEIGYMEAQGFRGVISGLKIVQHLGFCCSDKKCKAELSKDYGIELKGPAPSKKTKVNQ